MDHPFLTVITSDDPRVRDQSLDLLCAPLDASHLLAASQILDDFRRQSPNLYHRIRALLFLYSIHRFHLPAKLARHRPIQAGSPGLIPFRGYEQLLARRFQEAIDSFLAAQRQQGPSDGLSSALAAAYHRLAFQTLADQVRRSVRTVRGNQWMFRVGHPADYPLRIRPELRARSASGLFPVLRERTPLRMDLTHCGWSDIFFLGMDYPEGAKVLNISIDLGVHGRDPAPTPPANAFLRVIDEPLIRITSIDLGSSSDLRSMGEVFDFASDHLGLLKAALIASGIVPPGIEGSGQRLEDLLERLVGPGHGLELVSSVNDIPKGSRLAVSTNLLGSLVAVCMRATGQARSLTGCLSEEERRIVLARALLGEWLAGSGGGWQDSGGLWPGIKLISGSAASESDPEFGISRGRLLPRHQVLGPDQVPDSARKALQDSLVLVHGGMAQNVGPILEMVTEKYLLRSTAEWDARRSMLGVLDEILAALPRGDIRAIGQATTRNFRDPIQTIIPWASNFFTEELIHRTAQAFGTDFWGFWMLGGMSGGGMGFMFDPRRKAEAQIHLGDSMRQLKHELDHALPFAIEPVVFDYAINEHGTYADLLSEDAALLPAGYYSLILPRLVRRQDHEIPPARRADLDRFGNACRSRPELRGVVQSLFDSLLPRSRSTDPSGSSLTSLLETHGFDSALHERIRRDLREGRIGLAQNRLRAGTTIEDVEPSDLFPAPDWFLASEPHREAHAAGLAALQRGELAVVTLAAGAGSRWTQGAGVCKALHPFARLAGRHRTFLELHLAKSNQQARRANLELPHVFTTGYLTHEPIENFLRHVQNYHYPGPVLLSPGRTVGLRLVPTERDLRFQWEETPQQMLDEQQQKVRESLRHALIRWAASVGEASDYTDNLPLQCLHPVGHFFEIPNLIRNGTLARLLRLRPNLRHLLLHNIDTTGCNPDPTLFGLHLAGEACLTFEVITRRLEDRGGGLARVDGQTRLVEGLALPHESDEFRLSYYNSMTTWIDLDRFLAVLGTSRDAVLAAEQGSTQAQESLSQGIRQLASRLPTYITLKEVKKRWGHGQEDVFPVAQFEKLWSDLSQLPEVKCRFVPVPRLRGLQLKDQAQLDGWLRDGSAAQVEDLCLFS